jgi:hypothetical protein
MRDMARNIASMGLFATSNDNINMMFHAAEQIIGHSGDYLSYIARFIINNKSDSQENGTCATIWPLWKTSKVDLNLHDFKSCAEQAATLTIDDILLNAEKTQFFNNCLIHCILQIIVAHGGEKFNKFQEALDLNLPETDEKIELHKTPLYPLPAINIDKSTIIGNAEVIKAIFEELHIITEDIEKEVMVFAGDHATCVKVFAGDQLSLAWLRALLNIRAGQEKGYRDLVGGFGCQAYFTERYVMFMGCSLLTGGSPTAGTAIQDASPFTTLGSTTCQLSFLHYLPFEYVVTSSLCYFMPGFSTVSCLYWGSLLLMTMLTQLTLGRHFSSTGKQYSSNLPT